MNVGKPQHWKCFAISEGLYRYLQLCKCLTGKSRRCFTPCGYQMTQFLINHQWPIPSCHPWFGVFPYKLYVPLHVMLPQHFRYSCNYLCYSLAFQYVTFSTGRWWMFMNFTVALLIIQPSLSVSPKNKMPDGLLSSAAVQTTFKRQTLLFNRKKLQLYIYH